jgi:YMGG-like Gly-zipper
MKTKMMILILLPFMAVGGCATIPTGPSVQVMPGSGKTFEQFQTDDAVCRQWAGQQIGQSPQEAMNQSTGTGAAVGTAAGAVLGAVIGSASGHAGTGAAIGAGSGLLVGTAAGANAGQAYGMEAQRRYDITYQQCMVAKGNHIPGMAPVSPAQVVQMTPPPPVAVAPGPPQVVFQAPPRFIYSPHLGFYVAVETPYDVVFIDGQYYLSSNGFWYAAPYYSGPWVLVSAGRIPPALGRFRHEEIHRYRDSEYREYLRDRTHYQGRWHEPEERREHR